MALGKTEKRRTTKAAASCWLLRVKYFARRISSWMDQCKIQLGS